MNTESLDDMPEVSLEDLKEVRRRMFYIEKDLLIPLRSLGDDWQVKVNAYLREGVRQGKL